jgi:hypothetical protein
VDIKEVYKAPKTEHFKSIHAKTGIAFHDMIFYGAHIEALTLRGEDARKHVRKIEERTHELRGEDARKHASFARMTVSAAN